MPLQQIARAGADAAITGGPLAIGEDHTRPEGRQLVQQLMAQGLVKVLFLEAPKDTNRQMSRYLTDAVMTKQANLGAAAIQNAIRPLDGFLMQNAAVPMSTLIADALTRNIRVVFADKFYVRPDRAATPTAMAVRNSQVDRVFDEASVLGGANRSGCLILFGAAHFVTEDQGQTFANTIGQALAFTLHWIDMTA